MKKSVVLMVVMVLLSISVFAQTDSVIVSFSGDVAYYSKNLSTFTGLMFGENPSVVTHVNVGADYKKFNISAAYSGQLGIQHLTDGDRFNMLDLSLSYSVSEELNLSAGYELTYTDNEHDEFGHGVFAMAMFHKDRVSSTAIFFADPKIQNTYYIGSVDLQVGKNVGIYTLAGYTNTKDTPLYGLIGLKYKKGGFFAGTYWVFDKDNPGPVVSVGLSF